MTLAQPKKILLVEDSLALIALYQTALEPLEVLTRTAETLSEARELLSDWKPDLVLLDLNLPDGAGMDLLTQNRSVGHPRQFIIITSNGSINTAVDAMRKGAENFLVKPFQPSKLAQTVKDVLTQSDSDVAMRRTAFDEEKSEVTKNPAMNVKVCSKGSKVKSEFLGLVGKSATMQKVFKDIEIAGPTDANVLITGSTGTGKELCAEAIHKCSFRKTESFVVLNCAAIPRDLMESELFGHMKGSFTGATGTREGAAHLANGGTLFLDEIGEMDVALQSKLLRFVQNQTFQRVGSNKTEKVSVRFIAATNRDPLLEIFKGNFREDLYYRLNVIPLHLPELKQRGDDILLIVDSFVNDFECEFDRSIQNFSTEACNKLLSYDWPGNIRQLQNVVKNTLIFAKNMTIEACDIPDELMPERAFKPWSSDNDQSLNNMGQAEVTHQNDDNIELMQMAAFGSHDLVESPPPPKQEILKIEPLHLVERKLINMALKKFDGNVAKVASALDISASSVYRKKSMSE